MENILKLEIVCQKMLKIKPGLEISGGSDLHVYEIWDIGIDYPGKTTEKA